MFAFDYPLRPIHLTLLSWFTHRRPGVLPRARAERRPGAPGFLRRVLGRAVPAGIVIAVLTMAVFEIVQLDDSIDVDHARTVAVMVAGCDRAAEPVPRRPTAEPAARVARRSRWRRCFALFFLVPFTRDLFELPVTEPWAYGVAAVAIVVAYPLLVLGSWISARIAQGWRTRRAVGTARV